LSSSHDSSQQERDDDDAKNDTSNDDNNNNNNNKNGDEINEMDDETFLRKELAHLESLEDILGELEGPASLWDDDLVMWDESSLDELLGGDFDDDDDDNNNDDDDDDDDPPPSSSTTYLQERQESAARGLEQALLQGVVPVSAGVGSADGLPGDFGFDPLQLATRDLFRPTQQFLLRLLPRSRWDDDDDDDNDNDKNDDNSNNEPRPKALILRDYREAEIRHGRLAMLAAIFWPLQEMLDRFVLSEDQYGTPLIYSPITLPYFPLLMTAIMLLLGYLDIYSQSIKDMDRIGEAFLPGCVRACVRV